jgi:Putative metal-binding motif
MRMLWLALWAGMGCTVEKGVDADGDGYDASVDCDDNNQEVRPNLGESCDGVDNNCDGEVDEPGAFYADYWYPDADGDGVGDGSAPLQQCTQPEGYVSVLGDCDDGDSRIKPDAREMCDEKDNDCDGRVDVAAENSTTWFADEDGDGLGDADVSKEACEAPDGYADNDDDCDDTDANVGIKQVYYEDLDGDGFGNVDEVTGLLCVPFEGFVADSTDCNDEDSRVNPDATETCNAIDDNCDGTVDDGTEQSTYYMDMDQDGYGDAAMSTLACTQPGGYVSDNTDCADNNAGVNPGAVEVCNAQDDNCDGVLNEGLPVETSYPDADGDGFGDGSAPLSDCTVPTGYTSDNTDCDDTDAVINPDAFDPSTDDRIDQDCAGDDTCIAPVSSGADLVVSSSADATAFCSQYSWVGGSLTVTATALATLSDLSCVCGLDGDLTIQGNTDLTALAGLRDVWDVPGSLLIVDNALLTDLSGLGSLSTVGGDLTITGNLALDPADATAFAGAVTVGGTTTVSNNGP